MGCATSKKEKEDNVVSLCKERKRLLKLAVERRYDIADAQCKYNQSLYAVAAAIRLFVARHSSPSSPFLITFPATSTNEVGETPITNPMFLKQRPTEPSHETIPCQSSHYTVFPKKGNQEKEREVPRTQDNKEGCLESPEDEYETEGEENEAICEHFYGEEGLPAMSSTEKEFAWDFFNPFDGARTEMVSSFSDSSDEELRMLKEKEGIPDLEEDGERVMSERKVENMKNADGENKNTDMRNGDDHDANVSQGERNSFRMINNAPTNERELFEALKDVEDHFLRAYDSGLDVSRMLEANRVQLQSGLEELKESSNKLIRSITWRRSPLSRSSSCKSLVSCSSKSSTWTELKTDTFNDYGGMKSGSHSLTLGRLYAWEKKLYEEVKAADQTRKFYELKCSQLRNRSAKQDGLYAGDRTRAEVKDLHNRILVAIRSAETISERIKKLRDEELQPQLIELLNGLTRNWKIMLESHESQKRIMFEVTSFNCPAYGKFRNDSHRLATLQLEAELRNWHSCFVAYFSAQKAYIKALGGWLSKFIFPEVEFCSKNRSSGPELRVRVSGPALLATCHKWLASLEKLPHEAVICALKSFGKDIWALWVQQGEEQKQKRMVDGLAKELERKVLAFQRIESRILGSKLSDQELEVNMQNRIEYLAERKNLLDRLRKRIDAEKVKHHTSMEETQQITMKGLQTGFHSICESLAEFSKASVKMYADLGTYCETAKAPKDDKESEASYVEEMNSFLWC